MLEKITLEPQALATASIIWLHGLGADGHDFVPIAEELDLPQVRYIFPHAPVRPISLNNGYPMRGWYDIFGLGLDSQQDEAGIRAMQAEIETLVQDEIARGIPAERIVLAGFSQGGAMALQTALRYSHRLAGVLALSTYLPLKQTLANEKHAANQATPIFMAHGTDDSVILPATAAISRDVFRENGYALEWHTYDMPHSVCAEEIDDIRQFLQRVLR
ncbi:phospholipase/carboxylesterase [Methylovorus glucosotrophus]|uniref:alpha/beta hydrolase n=1 Tax=Methylovorus glucosotrophus TaxID=266009 RepID=UPI00133144A1|nr:alpha/beta fold hydrolase [Methylovorus glucosotrophus]KAF0836457.1 phospholipase/carboxylesterase [Methylovorus glucosotrophus]